MGRHRPRRCWDEGAVAVEAAFTLSWLLLLIFGIIEFGNAFWQFQTMVLALEEAGRYAMVHNPTANPSGPPAASCPGAPTVTLANCVVARADNILADYAVSGVGFSVGFPSAVTMSIQGTYSFDFIPSNLLPYGPITVTRHITVPLI